MANLKNLSERIKSVTSIQQVTKAMKMVAAAKVKKAQEKMEISRPYSKSTQDLICRILPQISVSDISLVEKRKVKNTGIIVITSDRGFAGSFNSSVIRLAEKEIDVAIFSAGKELSLKWAPIFAAKGIYVIDNSSAWRMDKTKKLIVPEINGHILEKNDKIIVSASGAEPAIVITSPALEISNATALEPAGTD